MDIEYSDYIVYVDESGDANLDKISPTFPVFVLSFCIFKKNSYAETVIPAMSKLKFKTFGHDMVVLHEREIRKKEGIFSQHSKEIREAFLEELTEIIDGVDLTLICVVIRKEALKSQYTIPYEPYALAMQYGLERIWDFLKYNRCENKKLHIVFESRGKQEDAALKLAFRDICCGENRNQKPYPFDIVFASKAVNSNGLQLADLTARPVGLYVMDKSRPNRTFPILEKKFWKGEMQCTHYGNGLKVFP